MLDLLEKAGIFCIEAEKDSIIITEMCDVYYSETLNKKEFKELIDELTGIYDKLED